MINNEYTPSPMMMRVLEEMQREAEAEADAFIASLEGLEPEERNRRIRERIDLINRERDRHVTSIVVPDGFFTRDQRGRRS